MKLILVRGVPGAGKSTYGRKLADERGMVHLENDQFMYKEGVYSYSHALRKLAMHRCIDATQDALSEGKDVVVTNCFLRRFSMQPYYFVARKLGAEIEEVVLDGGFKNVHGVPDAIVKSMKVALEK
jgi:predicted kinase